jgi:phospholipase/lecithinase/hemolysin
LVLSTQGQSPDKPIHPFQKAMLEFAEKEHVPVVNMLPVMSTKNQSAMFMDPAHPTAAGHQVIAGELMKVVQNLPSYTSACAGAPAVEVKSAQSVSPARTSAPVSSR